MRSVRNMLSYTVCVILLGATAACAQQNDSSAPPIAAYRPPLGGIIGTDTGDNPEQTVPVNQPLSGVQNRSLGVETARSYWQPHLDVFGTADSNAQETGQGPNWTTWTSVSAGVDVHRVGGISDLTVGYTSGGMYSNQSNVNSGVVQELSFADKLSFKRSTVSFFDQSSYLPESAFGFGGLGGAGLTGGGVNLPALAFDPGQTVLTGRNQMLTDTSAVEFDELLTRRSSLTFSGGYSLLHDFSGGGNLFNYGVINSRAGYNHELTPNDTVSIIYNFSDYRYSGSNQSLIDHTLQLSYGRLITGKLAFQIAAGPQAYLSQTSTSVAGGQAGAALTNQTQVLWTLNSSLRYQERRYGLGLSYNHGVNGGAGVLVGATTDTVAGSLMRQMSRTFSSGFTGGYSRNQGLPGSGAFANQSYKYWFGGLNVTEPLGPTIGLTVSYQVQYQTSNGAACIGPTCGANILRHLISVGVGWHERPLLF